ncbi:Gmad2 immunoglobulin-like domain-containing protein [Polycladomyces subterraneus]|uniref:Gmad2 immunoglobulin-like domain-containing protein n=1 Tax=Polycladomyces subterraneus TaxID=1016997 RepID=A0ABT8IHZ6_9BACL|nr:Gmad2 immunoglobulin-like domain-containing protein [Polycladomyces subterraneus]MDN4592372.1 Gmad2 immunoglobulin-like domain-containing protein [Polycladomyces subterraneus]
MRGKWMVLWLSFVLLAGCFQATSPSPPTSPANDVQLDQTLVIAEKNGSVTFDLKLRNNGKKNVRLMFSNEPVSFTIVQKGTEIAHVEVDSGPNENHEVILAPSEQVQWRSVWDLQAAGRRVPAGTYEVEVRLMPDKVNGEAPQPHQFLVKGTFEVHAASTPDRKPVIPEPKLENTAFRQLRVVGGEGTYRVTGEARVFEGVFNYAVTDGHRYLTRGRVQAENGAPSWAPFTLEISIPRDQLPSNGTLILELYKESSKNGSRLHQKEIVLEEFRPE